MNDATGIDPDSARVLDRLAAGELDDAAGMLISYLTRWPEGAREELEAEATGFVLIGQVTDGLTAAFGTYPTREDAEQAVASINADVIVCPLVNDTTWIAGNDG